MDLEDMRDSVVGDVVLPADPAYGQASATLMWPGAPAVVVRPKGTSDVVAALRYAVANDLVVSARSGGHGEPGFGTNVGGVVIDMSAMSAVQVLDPDRRVVRLGSGATWTEVARALAAHRMSLTSGDTGTVGVGGLLLGGGMGWMVRKYGLTIDNLIAATVVTADGSVRRVSEGEHPDLFWAIRGGGGNFGIAVDFDAVAHPMSKVVAGTIQYRMDDVPRLMRRWWDAVQGAVDELSTAFCVMPSMGGSRPGLIVFCCYAGDDADAAMRSIGPLLEVGTVTGHDVGLKPYGDVLHTGLPPASGSRVISRNTLVRALNDDLITVLADTVGSGRGNGPFVLRNIGGAMSRVPVDATAFAHRDAQVLVLAKTTVPIESTEAQLADTLRPWEQIEPFGIGSYVNFLGTATAADLANCYPPDTYRRLAEAKAAYDPSNLFNQNHNIQPGVTDAVPRR